MSSSPASRNPLLVIDGKKIQTIGDVHLGRSYVNGVPLHMKGTMEKTQRDTFERLLATRGVDYLVLVGDLFDSFVVDPSDVDFAVSRVLSSARSDPNRTVVVLRGNHDESKDLTRKSSFDNFAIALREAGLGNLHVIDQPRVIEGFGFISWSARFSAKELAEQLIALKSVTGYINEGHGNIGEDYSLSAVFGHWDVNLPSHANHYNMVPVEQLKTVTTQIITGHVHKPETVIRDGVTITITGSILPLAHGEQLDDELFYTLTREEYDKDPKKYENKAVRFVLEEGEELPEGNFLQIKAYVKPVKNDSEPETDTDTFDLAAILDKFLTKEGLEEKLRASVVERFKTRNAQED